MRPNWDSDYEIANSPNLPPGCIVCAWCQKVGMKLFTLKTPNGCKAFCSELCFTQCRRASFKKNKICDWCKHVRHTVNYVDFQDGEQQLQFCSDKCLNQYKMNIFCKETQAHLQMHTHLKEAACKISAGAPANLITPELWLRDCKTNGSAMSPMEGVDAAEDINSDGNISAAGSPSPMRESPLPPSSPVIIQKEKKEPKREHPPPEKEKDRHSKKSSSKHSSRKQSSESKSHSKPHREKKLNGHVHSNEAPRHSPVQASPSSQIRNSHSINESLLSPPPNSLSRPPLPPLGLPPRPPMPSPLGNLEHNRPPFLHHNMVPPPFQLMAQHQMEAFFRSQHGFDPRSKIPPPPPFHLPPWMTPPFPPHHRPPPPPHIPPPPINASSSKSPSMSHSSPISKNHQNQQSPVQKISHHGKHKHSSKHASTTSTHSSHPKNVSSSEAPLSLPSSLPPVTVMVPFPLLLPIPFPVPIPIPIPPSIMEKYSKLKQPEKSPTKSPMKLTNNDSKINGNLEDLGHRKRKNSHEVQKQKKRRRSSSGNIALVDIGRLDRPKMDIATDKLQETDATTRNIPTEKYFDSIENLSFRIAEPVAVDFSHGNKHSKTTPPDTESRSYSPLSEASKEEESERIPSRNPLESEDFSQINFSHFNLSLMRSSPLLLSQSAERQLQMRLQEDIENCKSPSPANLSVKEKHDIMSSSIVDFKKKHLRDQMSLMT